MLCHTSVTVGIAQWLECWTHDWKVVGSNPCWNGGIIFFSRVNFLCWLLFRYPFHRSVTAVARKRPRSFCQKCRWQVTAKHAAGNICDFVKAMFNFRAALLNLQKQSLILGVYFLTSSRYMYHGRMMKDTFIYAIMDSLNYIFHHLLSIFCLVSGLINCCIWVYQVTESLS